MLLAVMMSDPLLTELLAAWLAVPIAAWLAVPMAAWLAVLLAA